MSAFDTFLDGSFAGVDFWEQGSPEWQSHATELRYTEQTTLSGREVIQTNGVRQNVLSMPVALPDVNMTTMRGKVGLRGTLVYHAGTRTALLLALRPEGVAPFGLGVKATLELKLL